MGERLGQMGKRKYSGEELRDGMRAWKEAWECMTVEGVRKVRARWEKAGGKEGWLPWDELEDWFDELPTEV